MSTQLRIRKLKDYIGAEVSGVDLREPLSEADRARVQEALVEHVTVVFPGQELDAGQYARAMSQFGELMEDQNRRYIVPEVPLVSVLSNRHKDSAGRPAKQAANATWHTDHTNQERPPKFTCLFGLEVPGQGGATSVCNTRAAFEALPADYRARIENLQTENTLISSARFASGNPDIVRDQQQSKVPPVVHPLVRTHPERGSKAIWFHKSKTERVVGMDPHETQSFLEELLTHTLQPDFIYEHPWRPGDVLMIDNRSSLHKAGHDFDHSQHRLLYRVLVRGDRPF